MAVQATLSQEVPKKRRLSSPSQQAARIPAVRLAAPVAAKERVLSRNFGQYARKQQMVAAAPEEEAMPDRRQLRRAMLKQAARATRAGDLKFTGRKPSATLYGGVAAVALLKDMLDLVMIGSLPGIGTIITICFTFLIWIILAVLDRSSSGSGNRQITRGLILGAVAAVEGLGFGLNFLPIETLTVILLYMLAYKAYFKAMRNR